MTRSLAGGGVARNAVTLASSFVEKGMDVDVVLFSPAGSFLPRVPAAVRLVTLRTTLAPSIPAMMRYLLAQQPGVVLSLMSHASLAAIWARALGRAPTKIVASVPNMLSLEARAVGGLRGWTVPWLIRWSYPWADAIVAVSQAVADDLVSKTSLERKRIHVIYNPLVGIDLEEKAKRPTGHPWFDSAGPPVVLGVGRLHEEKDFRTLIRAVACLRRQRQIRLAILGDGNERPNLESLIRELGVAGDVELSGFQSNPYAFMARAAVLCLCSRSEGFGNVLVEAMACGCPVVATDCPGGPSEILERGRLGELVPVGDIPGLAAALARTLDHPPPRELLMSRAAEFSIGTSVEGYLKIITSVLEAC